MLGQDIPAYATLFATCKQFTVPSYATFCYGDAYSVAHTWGLPFPIALDSPFTKPLLLSYTNRQLSKNK